MPTHGNNIIKCLQLFTICNWVILKSSNKILRNSSMKLYFSLCLVSNVIQPQVKPCSKIIQPKWVINFNETNSPSFKFYCYNRSVVTVSCLTYRKWWPQPFLCKIIKDTNFKSFRETCYRKNLANSKTRRRETQPASQNSGQSRLDSFL